MKPDIHDVLIVAGVGMAAVGLWMVYPPAMFIAVGVGLLWLGMPRLPRLRR